MVELKCESIKVLSESETPPIYIKEGLDAAENFLNTLVESLAVLVVTSCIIPILVLIIFVWIIKKLIEVDLSKPLLICHDHIDKSAK